MKTKKPKKPLQPLFNTLLSFHACGFVLVGFKMIIIIIIITLEDNKRTSLGLRDVTLAWDVTVPDTYAESHIADTVSTPGTAAHQAEQHKIAMYSKLASTRMFYPIAIETAGTRDDMAIELVQEIGRRTTVITITPEKQSFCWT